MSFYKPPNCGVNLLVKTKIWFLWICALPPIWEKGYLFPMIPGSLHTNIPQNPHWIPHLEGFTKFSCYCKIKMGNLPAKTSRKPSTIAHVGDVCVCGSHVSLLKIHIILHPSVHISSSCDFKWLDFDSSRILTLLAAFHQHRNDVTPSSRWEASSSRSSRSSPAGGDLKISS